MHRNYIVEMAYAESRQNMHPKQIQMFMHQLLATHTLASLSILIAELF